MAATKARLTKLEARYGVALFEDLVRRLTDEELATLLALYGAVNTDRADETTLAEIARIKARYL
jgi:hypothetical protein